VLKPIEKLVDIVRVLRSDKGCPWDREQTHTSLKPMLVEEVYEALEAVDSGVDADLCEELGDLLLHLVMHAQIADERRAFNFDDVANRISHKLVARHPHVFTPYPSPSGETGRLQATTVEQVLSNWQQLKSAEKPERASVLDGIPKGLPALARATEVQKKASKCGFDWPDASGPLEKVSEELREIHEARELQSQEKTEEEFGDLLFTLANYSRFLGVNAEESLRRATAKFESRFRQIEQAVTASGKTWQDYTLDELESLWQQAKRSETL